MVARVVLACERARQVHLAVMTVTPVPLRTEGLTKRFGDTWALRDLDLEVVQGEVLGYLGPNGAGKTTTIRLVLGLLQPTAGRVTVFGVDARHDVVAAHRRLAYVPGETSLWPSLTGAEVLRLLGELHGSVDEPYRESLLERFDVDPTKKVRAYSKGNRQKLGLVAALMTRADLLVLDEPTSGLDPLMEQEFRSCVREARERGQAVLLSSHILSEVEAVCDRVAIIRAGRLVESGALADLRHLAAVRVEAVFDGPPPDVRGVRGVTADSVSVDGDTVRFQVHGPIDDVVAALAPSRPRRLLVSEPSLEELFLSHYGHEAAT
jgi:ABC-2 type transport system ATP-binding protein